MKYLYYLLVLVPLVIGMDLIGVGGHSLIFVLSCFALIPLAAVLGHATEAVAQYTGPKIGGLLNATLGNAAELIITIVALREGLVTVVKASIAGSIIGNVLLVLGASLLLGGIKNGTQRFNANIAGVNASIMALSVMALMIPAIFALGQSEHRPSADDIVNLSDGTAIVLIVLYGLYLAYTVFRTDDVAVSLAGHAAPLPETVPAPAEAPKPAKPAKPAKPTGASHEHGMKMRTALLLLAGSTIAIVFVSEILVGALEPTTKSWGLSELFVGVMLVPLVGNIAEHLVSVQVALKNQMDLSIGIAIGSAIQIALFVTPVLILVSQFVGPDPINLVFNQYELVALVAAIIITVMICIDGRSNWLEGAELIALYLILGLAFYFVP